MPKGVLAGKEFSALQKRAIELMAEGRLNQTEILEEIGVTQTTLWRWKKNPYFMDAVINAARTRLRESLPEVYEKLATSAIDGDYKFMKLLLEHLDKLEEMKHNYSDQVITFTWKKKNDTTIETRDFDDGEDEE